MDHQQNLPGKWWAVPGDELAGLLGVDPQRGLTSDQADLMRERYGANTLPGQGASSLATLVWQSIRSPVILLLLAIAGISLALGQYREAIVMGIVVALYVSIELLNKARADRTMARLRALQSPTTTVLRNGDHQEIPVVDIVVGDILLLQAGSRVAADARLLSSAGLLVNEAALTGESSPQSKDADAEVAPDAPPAERPTAVFAGTTVLDGQGTALVMAVGSASEFGRVALLATRAESTPTPLQHEMSDLARTLAVVAVVVSAVIPLAGWVRGFSLHQMILTWLSLTFLMVPGQPPIIITTALALASFELARKRVVVRHLQGAETLGSVTTIISDKTGTMTENSMALSGLILGDGSMAARDDGPRSIGPWQHFFAAALLAIPEITNDPTDTAILDAAKQMGIPKPKPPGLLVRQIGFAQGKCYRSLEYCTDGKCRLYLSGSPEFIVPRCVKEMHDDQPDDWDDQGRSRVLSPVQRLAAEGKRITAYAFGMGDQPENLVFSGCAVLEDPVRPGVRDAIGELSTAGIRTVMVTGDNPATAGYVARSVGLNADEVVTGSQIDRLSGEKLADLLPGTQVFARTTPENKLRLVEAFKEKQQVVAVTGDGINDAPALHTADVGIAMGITGTDVAKEVADLILTDDNFAHLPSGVEIGRKAYDNFRKGITYYLSAKTILLAVFVLPLLAGFPFPFTPIQIIATELLMDLASSMIFISEPAEPDIMRRKPRPRSKFLSLETGRRILRNMLGLTVAILAVYFASLFLGYGLASARTAAWSTWLLGHILLALNLKQERVPLLHQGLLANRFGAGWLAGMVVLVLAMTTVPVLRNALNTTAMNGVQWAMVILSAVLASAWIEVCKLVTPSRLSG